MIREVLKMGDPRLLQKAQPVERFDTPELHALLQDMRDTMAHLDGAGLAAPQIGVGLQVAIFGVARSDRRPDIEDVPETVLINPTLTAVNDEMVEAWEGCLSVPGMRGLVPRFRHLRYEGYDEKGNRIDRTVEGCRVWNLGSISNPKTEDTRAMWTLLEADADGYTLQRHYVTYDISEMLAQLEVAHHPTEAAIRSFWP